MTIQAIQPIKAEGSAAVADTGTTIAPAPQQSVSSVVDGGRARVAASFSTGLGLIANATPQIALPTIRRGERPAAVESALPIFGDRVEQQVDRLRFMLSGRRSLSAYEKQKIINLLYEVPSFDRPEFVRRMMSSYVRDESGFAWNLTRRALYLMQGSGIFGTNRYYDELVDYVQRYNDRIGGWRVHGWNDPWWRNPVALYMFFWWPNYSDPWNDPWSGRPPAWPAPRDPWMDRWGGRDPWESRGSDPWGGSGRQPTDPWEGPARPPTPGPGPSDPWDPPSRPNPPKQPSPGPSDPWDPPSRPSTPEPSPSPSPSDPWEPPSSPGPSIPESPSTPEPSPSPSEPKSPSGSDPW